MQEFIDNLEKTLRRIISETVQEELCKYFDKTKIELPNLSEEFLDSKQIRLLLKISKPTIYKLMKAQKLPFRHIGRRLLFPKSEVLKSINKFSKKRNDCDV